MIFDDIDVIIPTHPNDFKNISKNYINEQDFNTDLEKKQEQDRDRSRRHDLHRDNKFVIPQISSLHEIIQKNDSASDLISCLSYFTECLDSLFENNFRQNSIDFSKVSDIKNSVDKWFMEHSNENINNQLIYSLFSNLIESMFSIDTLFSRNIENEMQSKEEYSSAIKDLKMKNMRKSKESKYFKKEMISSNAQIRLIKSKMQKLIEERDAVKRELHAIFDKDKPIQDFLDEIEKNEEFGPQELTESLIKELLKNYSIIPRGRRYTKTMKSISFIIYSYSPIAYKTLAQYFPFPSEKTVTECFKPQMKETKNNLLNLSQLKVILDKLHDIYTDDKNEEIPSVLAVDAAAMKPNSDGKKAFFGFEIQPVNLNHKKKLFM